MDYARVANDGHYFNICKEQIIRFRDFQQKEDELLEEIRSKSAGPYDFIDLREERIDAKNQWLKAGTVVVVFSAMCLEALIFDYGCIHLSKNYIDKYLDNLTPVGKWVVIPRIITGEGIERGGEAFQLLQDLFRNRNRLVHSQSKQAPTEEEDLKDHVESRKDNYNEMVPNAMSAIFKTTSAVRDIHPESTRLNMYDPNQESNQDFAEYA